MAAQGDSLDFEARYGSWRISRSLSAAEGTKPDEVASFLIRLREETGRKAFEVLGIDLAALDLCSEALTKGISANGYGGLAAAYKATGSGVADAAISGATGAREELKPFARAYLLRSSLSRLGIDYCIRLGNKAAPPKAGEGADAAMRILSSDGIIFTARYGNWIAVKKMSIDQKTKPEEVAAHLSSIRMTAERKVAEVLGIDTAALEAYATGAMGKMRKSAANLERAASMLGEAGAVSAVDGACKQDRALKGAATVHLFGIMLRNMKLDLEVSPDTLMDMFPGLKIPKPRGRMPGQKRKA